MLKAAKADTVLGTEAAADDLGIYGQNRISGQEPKTLNPKP